MNDDRAFPTHVIAHMQLRAPRVAYVVPVTDDWHRVALHAMNDITHCWGGAGFVVIPVGEDGVHPTVMAALREYDPDAVLTPDMSRIDERHRVTVDVAQLTISAVCSNYRFPRVEAASVATPSISDLWTSQWSDGLPSSGQPTALADIIDDPPTGVTTVGANPALGGPLGLAAATRWGMVLPPEPTQVDIEDEVLRRALMRLSSNDSDATNLVGVTNRMAFEGVYETDLARTLLGLEAVEEFGPTRASTLVVWGDEPADFALAMVWDRTYCMGIWVPDEWWGDKRLRWYVAQGIDKLARATSRTGRELIFTSTSLSHEDLASRVDQCRNELPPVIVGGDPVHRIESEVTPADRLPFSRYLKRHFVIRENVSHEWSTTVYATSGSIEFAMLPPTPLISVREFERLEENAGWQVDVSVRHHEIPSVTAIPEKALLAAGESALPTRIRVSRAGISYQAHRTDFVPAGASVSQSLVRPLLRYPSLLAWADARASTHGMTARPSIAGTRATVLSTMMGERKALADLVASEFLPALKAFNAKGSTSDNYPSEEGCVVNNEGFLHFAGICLRAGIETDAVARDKVDDLLRLGILRRGLLVRCPVCQHRAFVNVEDVATTILCQRCLTNNLLQRELWNHQPIEEPTWFYDLHPTARALLRDNGDVPLLLSHHLRSGSERSFADAPEFELFNADGNREAETDLLALVDRQLIIAEAKSNNTLGTKKQRNDAARKRVMAAKVLVADEILLATTAEAWEKPSVEAMRNAIREQVWPSGRRPRLITITKLGGTQVTEEITVIN